MRTAKRKLRKKQLLSVFEMCFFCSGTPFLSGIIDEVETAKKWPELREMILKWWNSEDDRPSFCTDYYDHPMENRKGKLPYFEVHGKGRCQE